MSGDQTERFIIDLGFDENNVSRGEVLVTRWSSGEVDMDYRWPAGRTQTIWTPVQLAGGSMRVEHD